MGQPILVVEDDPALVRAIVRNLTARGYTARSAMTVEEATVALGEERPALVLLDVDLPDGSGWEVLRALRGGIHSDVPAIVMSALRPNPRLVNELGCSGVIEKPFPMEMLLRLVDARSGGAGASRSASAG
ncbi:MAG: response regulator transcription factor [Chloroflexi bacterium]|nr:response regulator transcription factor [Chloroflexota bacterium]